MSWYYIDGAGQTQGPVAETVITSKWGGEVTESTYIWNGTTVNQWSLIKDVPMFYNKCKAKSQPPAPSRPNPMTAKPKKRANPMMGGSGGRGGLLDAIRNKNKGALKKVEKKDLPEQKKKSGGGRPGGKMSLQDQLAMRLKKSGGPKMGGGVKKKSSPAPKKSSPAPKKKSMPVGGRKQMGGSSGGAGKKVNKAALKRQIDSCNEDWVLQAIQKLLK